MQYQITPMQIGRASEQLRPLGTVPFNTSSFPICRLESIPRSLKIKTPEPPPVSFNLYDSGPTFTPTVKQSSDKGALGSQLYFSPEAIKPVMPLPSVGQFHTIDDYDKYLETYHTPKKTVQHTPPTAESIVVDDEKLKKDHLAKIYCLKSSYDYIQLPDDLVDKTSQQLVALFDSLCEMVQQHETMRKLYPYLCIIWFMFELLGSKTLGLPLAGFAMKQLQNMGTYQGMVMEYAKKSGGASIMDVMDGLPVELRFFGISLLQVVVFCGIKFFAKQLNLNPDIISKFNIDNWFMNMTNPTGTTSGIDVAKSASADNIPPSAQPNDLMSQMASLLSMFTGGDAGDNIIGKMFNLFMNSQSNEEPQVQQPRGMRRRHQRTAEKGDNEDD